MTTFAARQRRCSPTLSAASSGTGSSNAEVFAEVPARVEYSLTSLGWSTTELLIALADWADEHMLAVEDARSRYDELHRRAPIVTAPVSSAHAAA
jgi:hypothetical protein